MMPDLGKYAVEVSAAYVIGLAIIGVLIGIYAIRNARVRNALMDAEERQAHRDG